MKIYKIWDYKELELLKSLRANGNTIKEIGKILGRSRSSILEKITNENIKISKKSKFRKTTNEDEELIIKYVLSGLTYEEISKKIGRSKRIITKVCKKNNIGSKRSKEIFEQRKLMLNNKRICRKCNIYKETNLFPKLNKSYCNECLKNERKIKYKESNKIGFSLEKFLLIKLKSTIYQSKKENILCNLTLEQLLDLWNKQNGKCYYTGIKMELRRNDDFSLTIDKKYREKGYTLDNIVLCCWVVNFIKNKIPIDSFLILSKLISDKHRDNIPNNYYSIYNKPLTPFCGLTKSTDLYDL